MEEIYGTADGGRKPMATETDYYERMRNERNDQFAPNYNDEPKCHYTQSYLEAKAQSERNNEETGNYHGFQEQSDHNQGFGGPQQNFSSQYGGDRYGNQNQQNWGGYGRGGGPGAGRGRGRGGFNNY